MVNFWFAFTTDWCYWVMLTQFSSETHTHPHTHVRRIKIKPTKFPVSTWISVVLKETSEVLKEKRSMEIKREGFWQIYQIVSTHTAHVHLHANVSGKRWARGTFTLRTVASWTMVPKKKTPAAYCPSFRTCLCRNKTIKTCPLSDPPSITYVIFLPKLQPVSRPSRE